MRATGRLWTLVQELEQRGEPYALATVVSRRPPVSARLGDKAVITADGALVGWIGGSCSQPVVRREAMAAIAEGRPRLVKLTREQLAEPPMEGVRRVAMTCSSGGEAEIYIEPCVQRPQLIAVGETPLVPALVEMAQVVGFDAVEATEVPAQVGRNAFVVVASAGHYDEEAVAAALRTTARYVALVASRKRAATVMAYLRDAGVEEQALARLRNPAGLNIGAATQEEIALSILAEIVQEYRMGAVQTVAAAPADDLALELLPMAAPQLARDPVCGMDVEVAGARHTAEHEGQRYYFCCPHCRASFMKDPAAFQGGGKAV